MLSCEIIPYTMLLQIKFQKNPTWRQPARWLVGSTIYLRVVAKTRTKNRPAISWGKGERDNIVLLADARHHLLAEQTPTVLSWSIYIYIYISIRFMLTTPFTSRTTGRFVVFLGPVFRTGSSLSDQINSNL